MNIVVVVYSSYTPPCRSLGEPSAVLTDDTPRDLFRNLNITPRI